MKLTAKNAHIYEDGQFLTTDFMTGEISVSDDSTVCHLEDVFIFPAFCDVHVHLREPGFFYKESISTGTAAAARGGYTDVFSMPNLNPVPDCAEHLRQQLEIIGRDACIGVHPFAAITVGQKGRELSDMESLSPLCAGFSDDGKGVQNEALMREAMLRAKALDKIIVAHCEDESLLRGGYIHDGAYAAAHGHAGICSRSEWEPVERDLRLAKRTGCKYHVCHVSTKESVALIRRAKADGIDVSCETAPHYLLLDDSCLEEDGRFKMNPPLRSGDDRLALIEGIRDGTIDMIATDHAPHSEQEKSRGLAGSLMGISGIETAFAVLYTGLVKTGIIPLERLIWLMSAAPRRRFGLPETQDICVFDLNREYMVDPENFLSKGKSTPFAGKRVYGENLLTIHGGKAVWQKIK